MGVRMAAAMTVFLGAVCVGADTGPGLRIANVEMAAVQPHETAPEVIFHDSFDGPLSTQAVYLEPKPDSPHAKRSDRVALGGRGLSMECFYPAGQRGIGNRKIVFGDCPFGKPLRRGEVFEDIYWRLYVYHRAGWAGGGAAKLSRATGFVSSRWNQAFIAHVWSSGDVLTLDPVSGVRDGKPVTEKYNDFDRFKWLGNSPKGRFPLHSPEESGRWVCVEARLKLNTPGKKDGECALWVDGKLDARRTGMDFRGTYTGHGINAVFLEAYWNDGSPVDQSRYYDDFVVSTAPVGPLTAPDTPELQRTDVAGLGTWRVEIAAGADGRDIVWRSGPLPGTAAGVRVDAAAGRFVGSAEGRTALAAGPVYFCRAGTAGAGEGTVSDWHQPFRVAERAAEPGK